MNVHFFYVFMNYMNSTLKPKSLSFGNTKKSNNHNKSYQTATSIKSITNISSFKRFMTKMTILG
jgi:hypothetical protein